jgi:hypothetical protein
VFLLVFTATIFPEKMGRMVDKNRRKLYNILHSVHVGGVCVSTFYPYDGIKKTA